MKKFFTFLLYLLVILLIAGICFGVVMLLDRPLEEGAIAFGLIISIWLLVVLIKKIIIRYRAKAQVERVLQQENAIIDAELGKSSKELLKDLKKGWGTAIRVLKGSHLKLKGDPLYVLPWYMVFGKPRSGKSTALRNAQLLTPAMELSDHEDGSTLNMEWWLYDQAIVIDTAGRYAVPDVDKRDKKEWTTLLKMLSRHKQKEPLNGLVLVITADRLLNNTDEELRDEGQQIRSGINELMERLEVQMPVYLMITKCDLVDQFTNWCEYLPEESRQQVMGYLFEEVVMDVDAALDTAFDKVLDRLKELRLLMMERSDNPDDSLIELPLNLEKLRSGVHSFAQTALKNNLYQETPKFRGLYFSASQKVENVAGSETLINNGTFLHHLFTKVMPPDRGILSTLPSAERLRRAARNYGMSISGAALVMLLVALTTAYISDSDEIDTILRNHQEINLVQDNLNTQINSHYRLHELLSQLEKSRDEWTVAWYGPFKQAPQYEKLVDIYNTTFQQNMLASIDRPLSFIGSALSSEERAYLVSGLVRRINLIKAKLAETETASSFDELPEIPGDYLKVISSDIDTDASQLFDTLYRKYVMLQPSRVALEEEQLKLQAALQNAVTSGRGNYEWLVTWTNTQGFPSVKVGDFWGGSGELGEQPSVPSAYTLEGRDFILAFLDELENSSGGSVALSSVKDDFLVFYERRYLKAWVEFAENFDIGKNKLRGRKEWLTALESMTGRDNPYFNVMRKIEYETEPVYSDGIYQARDEIEFFAEMQDFVGDASGAGDSKAKKKATKTALKLIGKMGKVGKMVAKAGKKGLKAKKKMDGKDDGPGKEDVTEEASKTYLEYKKALQTVAFNADSGKISYNSTLSAFDNPDDLSSGEGGGAQAWAAIRNLQMLIGKPRPSSQVFWNLYTGPARLAFDYMHEEAACHLQDQWEDTVLVQASGVNEDKLGQTLIGEGGLVWNYIDGPAAPFLKKKFRKGYVPNRVNKKSMHWEPTFVNFVNNGDDGRNIVANEFTVKISALPTGINQEASISPYATYLDMYCADGVQTLSNYNYSASHDFLWSLDKCGEVTLRIEVGEYSLRKQYTGKKGFSKFLADFRDGRRVFTVDEFPDYRSQLENESVKAIDVNYKIVGQGPVVKMLTAVPLDPPQKAIMCWPDKAGT